mgnify:CR=1 FL=1
MDTPGIDLSPLRKALGVLAEALQLWHSQDAGSVLKPHLRSAVIQSFEFSYELSLRSLRRVLVERAGSADRITDLSFNELLRHAADAGLVQDPKAWRIWREFGFDGARGELLLYGVQLAFNAAWSWFFFVKRSGVASTIEVSFLLTSVVATMIAFWRRDAIAGALFVPYVTWVSFATALTVSVWRRNLHLL